MVKFVLHIALAEQYRRCHLRRGQARPRAMNHRHPADDGNRWSPPFVVTLTRSSQCRGAIATPGRAVQTPVRVPGFSTVGGEQIHRALDGA